MANVTGPGSSTDTAIARWNGTSGTVIQDSAVTIDNSNNIAGLTSISSDGGDFTSDGSGNVTLVSLTGSPTTTTQSSGDNSTKVATTAFVMGEIYGLTLSSLGDVVAVEGVGVQNIILGEFGGISLTTGAENVGLGYSTLRFLTTGRYNVAVGMNALQNTTSGQGNIAVGFDAMLGADGTENVAIGYGTFYNLTGDNNIGIGTQATTLTNGDNNILIGNNADVPTGTTSNYLNIGGAIIGDMTSGPALMDGFTATTQSPGDNSTQIATTAYVDAAVAAAGGKAPTFQYLTSGTGATYTRPAGCTALNIEMVGPGGGGAACITNNGGAGGDTIFNGIHAAGGSGGVQSGAGGAGGTGGTGTASLRISGEAGGADANARTSGKGGSSPFGGAGGSVQNATGRAGAANSGSGGSGGSSSSNPAGGGGGAGEYVELYISSPASTYTYTIGAGGSGGAAGTEAGGAGGSGLIKVAEYY